MKYYIGKQEKERQRRAYRCYIHIAIVSVVVCRLLGRHSGIDTIM